MPFAVNDVATLVRVPPGVFTMLQGRMMVILVRGTSATGRDRYTVTPLVPLSAAEKQALGVQGVLQMDVYAGQLQAVPSQAVYVDVSGPD